MARAAEHPPTAGAPVARRSQRGGRARLDGRVGTDFTDGAGRRGLRVVGARERREGTVLARSQVAEIQRSRLLAAAVAVADELGYANASVADIVTRARISRRTFYELFANREECLSAVLEDAYASIGRELEHARLEELPWRERVRTGLSAILSFFDREPVLARMCVVQALGAGPAVLERREQLLAALARAVDEGRQASPRAGGCTVLTAEGLVGAAFAIVYARVLRREQRPLSELLNELTGMIVLPYLGPGAARREQARPLPPSALGSGVPRPAVVAAEDPLRDVPMRLTHRTALVLEAVCDHPGASNREIADLAGVHDPGQISKLLRRLTQLGLLANRAGGHVRGEANVWRLTAIGEQVARGLRAHSNRDGETSR